MSRVFNVVAETIMKALHLPFMSVLIEIPGIDLYLTNLPRTQVIGDITYLGTAATDDEFTLEVAGMSENMKFDVPAVTLTIGSLVGFFQEMSLDDIFRGELVTIRIVYVDQTTGIVTVSGWDMTFRCDMDSLDEDKVTLRMASSDSARGDEYPRNTNQDYACQEVLGRGRCYYRHAPGAAVSLLTCDHGYDTTNGCKPHFPDLIDPDTGGALQQPKPFNGNISQVDEDFIVRGR